MTLVLLAVSEQFICAVETVQHTQGPIVLIEPMYIHREKHVHTQHKTEMKNKTLHVM